MIFEGTVGERSQTEDLDEGADAAGRGTTISSTGIIEASLSSAALEELDNSYLDFIISVREKWEIDN